jgi:hypothetical protein
MNVHFLSMNESCTEYTDLLISKRAIFVVIFRLKVIAYRLLV